jgi:hypothetical protein
MAGVKRQYLGCAGRVANGVNTVHLSYVREKTGHAPAAGALSVISAVISAGHAHPSRQPQPCTGTPIGVRRSPAMWVTA